MDIATSDLLNWTSSDHFGSSSGHFSRTFGKRSGMHVSSSALGFLISVSYSTKNTSSNKNQIEHSLNPNIANNPSSCGRYRLQGFARHSGFTLQSKALGSASQQEILVTSVSLMNSTFGSLNVDVAQKAYPKKWESFYQ